MAPPRKTIKRKSSSRSRKSKLEPFAPPSGDMKLAQPVSDQRIIRLEWASVFLGILSVFVAALGYWYVFGKPIMATPAARDLGILTEQAQEAASENYKIAPADPQLVEIMPERAPSSVKVAVFSTVNVKGAAATLKNELTAAGFTVATIGNQRPTQTETTLKVKAGSSEFSDDLRAVVEKKYSVTVVGTLEETSPYDAVVVIGQK